MATFYKANLILVVPKKLNKILKGQTLSERMENDGICPSCGKNEWWLLPDKCVVVREGGKPYCECLSCGYQTHL